MTSERLINKKRNMSTDKGFSLVELVVTITVIVILAGATAPLLIRYIDKARKAIDIQTGLVIFRAAELAYTSGNDEAYAGYSVCYDAYSSVANSFNNYNGSITATSDGYYYSTNYPNSTQKLQGYYALRPIAWCRGAQFSGTHDSWENVLMKSALDNAYVNYNGKRINSGDLQREYTDELLWALAHEQAQGETDTHGSTAKRKYDGYSQEYLRFRYNKEISYTKNGTSKIKPETWIVYRRDDNAMVEVWIGYKISGGPIRGLRRIYPDPAPDYK